MKTQISIEGLHKRVSASQRDFVTAKSNQSTIRKPWKSLAAVAFGLFLSVPGLALAQYSFTEIDVHDATATSANGNSTHEIAGHFFRLTRKGKSWELTLIPRGRTAFSESPSAEGRKIADSHSTLELPSTPCSSTANNTEHPNDENP